MFNFFKKNNDNQENIENKEQSSKSFWTFSFDNLKKTISNTTQNLVNDVVSTISQEEEFDDFILDDMEDLLIKADLGVNLAGSITDKLRKQTKVKPSQVKNFLKEEFTNILNSAGKTDLNFDDNNLNIYLSSLCPNIQLFFGCCSKSIACC